MRKRGNTFHGKGAAFNSFAGLQVIDNKRALREDQKTSLGLAYWPAFHALCTVHGSEANLYTIANALNIAEALCGLGIGHEHLGVVQHALEGVKRAFQNAGKRGGFGFDGEARKAIVIALQVHDWQVEVSHKDTMLKALEKVRKFYEAQK